MSLVVAAIHDDSLITLVCDTKVTWQDDEARNRQILDQALPKIVLLRDDLAVGVTGSNPHGLIQGIVRQRHRSLDTLLEHLARCSEGAFVVAALGPARLWIVNHGEIEDRTELRRAWCGDHSAYELFQRRALEWPPAIDVPFRLLSSMQWLTSFAAVPAVGGYTIRATTTENRFTFVADQTFVGPWFLELNAHDGQVITATVPIGGDTSSFRVFVLPGCPPNAGALGLFVPQAQFGMLFKQDRPWEPARIPASDLGSFVALALTDHDQILMEPLTWPA